MFAVITIAGLLCRNLYTKGLTKRFPDTNVSNSAFSFCFVWCSFDDSHCVGDYSHAHYGSFDAGMQSGQLADTYNGINIYVLYMGASAATYFYFLLYTTASVEYVWRRFLQKNLALLQTEAAKDTVDASDVVTAIIEAGESGLDNSGLKKLGDVDDFKEKVQSATGKKVYNADSDVHTADDEAMEVEGSKSSI